MPDISLHRYNPSENNSALNAPHRFRYYNKRNQNTDVILDIWNSKKEKYVLSVLMNKIQEIFALDATFAFAVAPSNTRFFVDDIQNKLQLNFINAIDISGCFSKVNGFEALNSNRELADFELRQSYLLDVNCFNQNVNENIKQLLLIDDVYAIGNTFNGMKILIRDINPDIEIKTAVILTTT